MNTIIDLSSEKYLTLRANNLDISMWNLFYEEHRQKYLRKRLLAIKLLHEGKSKKEILKSIGCSNRSLSTWISHFLIGGFDQLLQPVIYQQKIKFNREKNRTEQLCQSQLDLELWNRLFYECNSGYLKKRLLAIRYLLYGKSRKEVVELLGCNYKTLSTWIDKFLSGGLLELARPITHQTRSRLSSEKRQELAVILILEKPRDYGIGKELWTSNTVSQLIEIKWGIKLKRTRINEILKEIKESSPIVDKVFELRTGSRGWIKTEVEKKLNSA